MRGYGWDHHGFEYVAGGRKGLCPEKYPGSDDRKQGEQV